MSLFPPGFNSGITNKDNNLKKKEDVNEKENIYNEVENKPNENINTIKKNIKTEEKTSIKIDNNDSVSVSSQSEEKQDINNSIQLNNLDQTNVIKKDKNNFSFPTSVKIGGLTTNDKNISNIEKKENIPEINVNIKKPKSENNIVKQSIDHIAESENHKIKNSNIADIYLKNFSGSQQYDGAPSLFEILDLAIKKEASDIHIASDSKLAFRINGKITFLNEFGELSADSIKALLFSAIPNPILKKQLFDMLVFKSIMLTLSSLKALQDLTYKQRKEIADSFTIRKFFKNEQLIIEHLASYSIIFILRGDLIIAKENDMGEIEEIKQEVSAADLCAYTNFSKAPNNVLEAKSDGEYALLSHKNIIKLVEKYPCLKELHSDKLDDIYYLKGNINLDDIYRIYAG